MLEKTLKFAESTKNGWKILSAIGKIDTVNSTDAEKIFFDVLKVNDKLALDLSALNYISSAGLRILLRLAKDAKKSKKSFAVFGVVGRIANVFSASGTDMLITIYKNSDELP